MSSTDHTENTERTAVFQGHSTVRVLMIIAAVLAVFVASYAFATAQSGAAANGQPASDPYGATATAASAGGDACGSGDCCGGSGEELVGTTSMAGDVQRIDVAIENGYAPNIVYATAGVPIEITFAQGSGCYAEVQFPQFGVFEDLTQGPVTITLPALERGEYGWSCGMEMAYGAIVVE